MVKWATANANRRRNEILSYKKRIKDKKLLQQSSRLHKGWTRGVVYGCDITYPIALWLSASLVEEEKSDHVRHRTDNKGNETVSVEHWKNKRIISLSHAHIHIHCGILLQDIPEMRTPPLIRTLWLVPAVTYTEKCTKKASLNEETLPQLEHHKWSQLQWEMLYNYP